MVADRLLHARVHSATVIEPTAVASVDLRSPVCSHARAPGSAVALTSEGFEKLLATLSPDREHAGERYEVVRLKLTRYFELRMCPSPDDLADETIDRVARRLAEGEQIVAPEVMRYVYGVARNVLLESMKSETRHRMQSGSLDAAGGIASLPHEEFNAEQHDHCHRQCLTRMQEQDRDLLLQYYRGRGQPRIDRRQQLANELGIPMNALRIRIHRLRSHLRLCVEKCMRSRS
jgi:DNA-directed RNA polymerase specialized sigma24 family protein